VSAALIFHGTPPFHVYYRTQKDNEHSRELSKTFPSSRGELTLQPERSGHYTYSFVQMSDANYKKVELHGPSIDQVVHPLAAAEFASGQAGTGRNKRVMSSCSGSMVDVDVELKVRIFPY
jgi:nucleoporin POM152